MFLSAQCMLPNYASCAVRKLENLNVSKYKLVSELMKNSIAPDDSWGLYSHERASFILFPMGLKEYEAHGKGCEGAGIVSAVHAYRTTVHAKSGPVKKNMLL